MLKRPSIPLPERAPFIRTATHVSDIMRDVQLALVVLLLYGVWLYGVRVLWVSLLATGACMLTEELLSRSFSGKSTLSDGSALVTGLIFALSLPPAVAWYVPVAGGIFAILVVKFPFGGIGYSVFNPAMAARVFVMVSWPTELFNRWSPAIWMGFRDRLAGGERVGFLDWWAQNKVVVSGISSASPRFDGLSYVTPLAYVGQYQDTGVEVARASFEHYLLSDLFLGIHAGSIGETSVVLILLVGCFLLFRRVIRLTLPVTYVGVYGFLAWVLGGIPLGREFFEGDVLRCLLSGPIFFTAIFVITEYTTAPTTRRGQIVYASLAAFITFWIWSFYSYVGVSYAVLLVNLCTPVLNAVFKPRILAPRIRG